MNIGRSYGDMQPVGTTIETSCVTVRSFHESLRSSPGSHGPDWFVGYLDFGPGMPRGHVFLVSPLQDGVKDSVGDLLMDADPRRREFWLEANLIEGSVGVGENFKAFVPPKQHSPSPNSTIVERQAILVRGMVVLECGKPYLVSVQGNESSVSLEADWPRLEDSFVLFRDNLSWPSE